jgi:uncharacterized protein YcbX
MDQRKVAAAAAGLVTVSAALGYLLGLRRSRNEQRAKPVIQELWVYPVKGCHGVTVDQVELTEFGCKYDREWVVLKDDESHTVVTLRNCPRLALVNVIVNEDSGHLILVHQEHGCLKVPLHASAISKPERDEDLTDFALWKLDGKARHEGREAAEWFSKVCGMPVGLYRTAWARDPAQQPAQRSIVPPGSSVLAHDFSTVMIISRGTVEQAREASGDATVCSHRFRANVVLSTPEARDEDGYRTVVCNGITFVFAKYCTRCQVPSVLDNGTFHPQQEPTATLRRRYSARMLHDPQGPAKPIAGINVFHRGVGVLRVGDRMSVTEMGQRPTLVAASA